MNEFTDWHELKLTVKPFAGVAPQLANAAQWDPILACCAQCPGGFTRVGVLGALNRHGPWVVMCPVHADVTRLVKPLAIVIVSCADEGGGAA